jgi:hypothetical protein
MFNLTLARHAKTGVFDKILTMSNAPMFAALPGQANSDTNTIRTNETIHILHNITHTVYKGPLIIYCTGRLRRNWAGGGIKLFLNLKGGL